MTSMKLNEAIICITLNWKMRKKTIRKLWGQNENMRECGVNVRLTRKQIINTISPSLLVGSKVKRKEARVLIFFPFKILDRTH